MRTLSIMLASCLLLVAVDCPPDEEGQSCRDLRQRAWGHWNYLTREASRADAGIPIWQVWCSPLEVSKSGPDSRCGKRFVFVKGANLTDSPKMPLIDMPPGGQSIGKTSVHFNGALAKALYTYRGPGSKPGWLVSTDSRSGFLLNATQPLVLDPFASASQREATSQKTAGRVPIAAKASWIVFRQKTLCESPDDAKVPYYRSPDSVGPDKPYPMRDWPEFVTVDFSAVPNEVPYQGCQLNFKKPSTANSRPASDFHWFQIKDTQAPGGEDVGHAGDIAVLVGFHLAVRETKDWVWSTFFWDPQPEKGFGSDRPNVTSQAPKWKNYVMRTSTQQTASPASKTVQPIFNPYLEAGFMHGRESNCMNCHRLAAIGRRMPSGEACIVPIPDTAKPLRAGNTILTDYLWSMTGISYGGTSIPWKCADFIVP